MCFQELTRLTNLRSDWWVGCTNSRASYHIIICFLILSNICSLPSQSNSEQVCQLHLELEENLSYSFVQHEAEEEEEREKAENKRWFVWKRN